MKKLKQYVPYLLALAVLILMGLSLQECERNKALRAERDGYYNGLLRANEELLRAGSKIGELEVAVTRAEGAAKALAEADSAREFAQIQTRVVWRTRYVYRTVTVPAEPTPENPKPEPVATTTGGLAWPLGQRFTITEPWYGMYARLDTAGLSIDTLYFMARPEVVIGYRRRAWPLRFLSSPTLTATVRDMNPHAQYMGGAAVVVQPPPKKWYETGLFRFGAGLITGVAAAQATRR